MRAERTALVIGGRAADGAILSSLAASGYRIAAIDPGSNGSEMPAAGQEGIRLSVRLADSASVNEAFERVHGELGRIDVMLHLAAYDAALEIRRSTTEELGNADWHEIVKGLLNGAFFCTRAALQRMIPQRSGRIVYGLANEAVQGDSHAAVSTASCGILALMSSLAPSSFGRHVTLNSILVGRPYSAADLPTSAPAPSGADERPLYGRGPGSGRETTLRELYDERGVDWAGSVAAAVDHLCSDGASLVTGTALRLSTIGRYPTPTRWTF